MKKGGIAVRKRKRIVGGFLVLLVAAAILLLKEFGMLPEKTYTAEDFDIETKYSIVDFDEDGIDDYTDIMLGARKDAKNHPEYNGAYVEGGYPEDDIGVCSDVVWRAFKNAGYCLKDMVDADIQNRLGSYPRVDKPDPNIDFRRVKNLRVFFQEYALSLTTDITEISQWQPGDIVIFEDDKHIGIVSDKRNKSGHPYIIHNGGQPNREEDYLYRANVTGHYRFDASLLDKDMLIKWQE